jgi:outer membrane lipoprotein carrier protein
MRQLLNISVVLLLALAVAPAYAQPDPRTRLNDFFSALETLDGRFDQTVFDDRGEVIQRSSGRLELLRPGRFRWSYAEPFERLIISDGQFLWVYDPELAQATVRRIGDALGVAPIMLLSQPRALADDFLVMDAQREGDLDWVELKPKVQDTDFVRVRIALDAQGVRALDLYDQFGQRTEVRFSDLNYNTEVAPSRFRFEVPAGVDVIGPG